MKGARRILTLFRDRQIAPTDLAICEWLSLLRYETEVIHHSRLYCSAVSLSEESGLSLPSVRRSLQHLEALGLIGWEGKATSRKRHPVLLWQGDTVKQSNTNHPRSESSPDSDHDSDHHTDHPRSEISDHPRSESSPSVFAKIPTRSDPSSLSEKRGEGGPALEGPASPSLPETETSKSEKPEAEDPVARDARMRRFFAEGLALLSPTTKKPSPTGGFNA